MSAFFIIGCPRSGTTALTNFLQLSNNCKVSVEIEPKLCIESREMYEGRLSDPGKTLLDARQKLIAEVNEKGLLFGDKNPNYLPFLTTMERLWQPKYVFVVRDGREVVRSMMDWHQLSRGSFFDQSEDSSISKKTRLDDWWDYSRIRPREEMLPFEWLALSRFEKMAWYWNKFNQLMIKSINKIDPARTYLVNLSETNHPWDRLVDFLSLEFEDISVATQVMTKKVNSVKDRFNVDNVFPEWTEWDTDLTESFDRQASPMMNYLKF